MKYLKKFDTHSDYEAFTGGTDFILPNISVCVNENEVHYNPTDKKLTFIAEQANSTIKLNRRGTDTSLSNASLQYSIDNGETWNNYTFTQQGDAGYSGETITLTNVGDTVKFKGINTNLSLNSSNNHRFVMSGKISSSGDVTSLINDIGGDCRLSDRCFSYLFYDCASLTTPPNLPSTSLGERCYLSMFFNCTSLTVAPKLPATELKDGCYANMFYGCTSLTTVPELPATELVENCYYYMFLGCSSLIESPELPATTLANSCYFGMFRNCTSLITAPSSIGNSATTMASSACSTMFMGCTSLTTAPELPATNLSGANYCYQSMFESCTSLTTAPELPAIILPINCYYRMFFGCSNLNYIKAMFTTRLSNNCTTQWVNGVSSSGRFIKNSSATWTTTGVNGVPTGWTVETADA